MYGCWSPWMCKWDTTCRVTSYRGTTWSNQNSYHIDLRLVIWRAFICTERFAFIVRKGLKWQVKSRQHPLPNSSAVGGLRNYCRRCCHLSHPATQRSLGRLLGFTPMTRVRDGAVLETDSRHTVIYKRTLFSQGDKWDENSGEKLEYCSEFSPRASILSIVETRATCLIQYLSSDISWNVWQFDFLLIAIKASVRALQRLLLSIFLS